MIGWWGLQLRLEQQLLLGGAGGGGRRVEVRFLFWVGCLTCMYEGGLHEIGSGPGERRT